MILPESTPLVYNVNVRRNNDQQQEVNINRNMNSDIQTVTINLKCTKANKKISVYLVLYKCISIWSHIFFFGMVFASQYIKVIRVYYW